MQHKQFGITPFTRPLFSRACHYERASSRHPEED